MITTVLSYDSKVVYIMVFYHSDIETKIRCFIKKKYVSLFIFSPNTEEVEEKEKKSPRSKRKTNKNKTCLSIFLHHFAIKLVFSLPKLNIFILFKFFHYQFFEIVTSIFKIAKLVKRCSSWAK